MTIVNIRRQGGAAILTIPAALMQALQVDIGSEVNVEVIDGTLVATPHERPGRKRYSLKELLRGATPATMKRLNAETEWARDGKPVGREI